MKPDFNKRYATIAMYCALVLVACIFCVFLLMNFGRFINLLKNVVSILSPILIGALLAYMIAPCVGFFEKNVYAKLDKKKKYRAKRTLSVISAFLLVIAFLLILVLRVIPSVFRGYADLQVMSGLYLELLKDWLLGFSLGEEYALSGYFNALLEHFVGLVDRVYGVFDLLSPDLSTLVSALVSILSDVVLGIILSIYFLFSKERLLAQFKKMARGFLSSRRYISLIRSVGVTSDKFGGFLKGQVADALLIGSLSFVCLSIIGVPYYPLVSVLVGISSLVPLFGSLIGTVFGAVIIFLADPLEVIWFILFMIVLHLINKHMIRPKVVRRSADVSSAFMLTAIIVMTGIVGFWGLILGVPVFALLYAFLHSLVDRRLYKRGLPVDPLAYYATDVGKGLYLENETKKAKRNRLYREENVSETENLEDSEKESDTEETSSSVESETLRS